MKRIALALALLCAAALPTQGAQAAPSTGRIVLDLAAFGGLISGNSAGGAGIEVCDTTTVGGAGVVPSETRTAYGSVEVTTLVGHDVGSQILQWSYSVDPLLTQATMSITVASEEHPGGTITATAVLEGGLPVPGAGQPGSTPCDNSSPIDSVGLARNALVLSGSVMSSTVGGGNVAAGGTAAIAQLDTIPLAF